MDEAPARDGAEAIIRVVDDTTDVIESTFEDLESGSTERFRGFDSLRFRHVDHRERPAAPAGTAVDPLSDVDTLGTGASGVVTPMQALQLIAAIGLLVGNFFFVAVEFAVTNARPTMVRR
jgi:hypothetical protein